MDYKRIVIVAAVALFMGVGGFLGMSAWQQHQLQHQQLNAVIGVLNYAIQSGQIKLPTK